MTWLKKSYRYIVDHLTKAIGIVGMAVMSAIAAINPDQITATAQTYSTYLGVGVVTKIGMAMFGLVTFRGWWTGYKSKLKDAEHAKLLQDHLALQAQVSSIQAQLEEVKGLANRQPA